MLWDALNTTFGVIAGLATGFATGYYFERRQTRAARAAEKVARAESARLRRELDELRATMTKLNINVIGSLSGSSRPLSPSGTGSLADDLVTAAKRMVDGAGRVRIGLLYEKFCAEQFTVEQVDAAIQSLVDREHVARDRGFLEVKV